MCLVLKDVASEPSNITQRIESLGKLLRQRKAEAEELKREQRRQRNRKLKAKEESLQRQIAVSTTAFLSKPRRTSIAMSVGVSACVYPVPRSNTKTKRCMKSEIGQEGRLCHW